MPGEGPIVENTGHIDGVKDMGNNTAYDNEHGKVSVPVSISGDPVNKSGGDLTGGPGGTSAR